MLAALWLGACKDGAADGPDEGGTDSGTDTPLPLSSTVTLEDASNLTYTHAESIPVLSVSPGQDFALDWSGLTLDVWGRPAGPAYVQTVEIGLRSETAATLAPSLAEIGPDEDLYTEHWQLGYVETTSTTASQLSHTGHPFEPGGLALGETLVATALNADAKVVQLAIVEASGGADSVAFGGARYGATLTLSGRTPTTGASLGPWTLDWSALSVDATGHPLDPANLETLFVAHFADEAGIDLLAPDTADGYWLKYVPGKTSIDPAEMNDVAGDPFPGFDTTGAWVVGFRCVNCPTELPQFAARVRVEP